MYIALDVYYYADGAATAVAVCFEGNGADVLQTFVKQVSDTAPYEPGAFYKRELPCLLELLKEVHKNKIDAIIIDGYVFLDEKGSFGLGGYLWEALGKNIPVIGVAKTSYRGNKPYAMKITRGLSKSPLYISAVGTEPAAAAEFIQNMKGSYRMPEILKYVDGLTRAGKEMKNVEFEK